jgi:UDP-N-acetyl-D-glucosamine dehydrogenase
MNNIIKKITNNKAVVGVVGLGYVGLPLVKAFIESNIKVIGFDIDKKKIELLKKKKSYIKHIDFNFLTNKKNFEFTSDFKKINKVDVMVFCLPTPLNKKNNPDLSFISNTMNSIQPYLRVDQCISLESTTYPGTTRELIVPYLINRFNIGKNFFLIYSPERVDPGRSDILLKNIPKVVGGYSDNCLKIGCKIYSKIFKNLVPVKSIEIAEFTKILENVFRAVNISLINELKVFSNKINININDVIKASSTKPFGYMPFYPGPGIGGHCIPIDPIYLSYAAKKHGLKMSLIDNSFKINFETTKKISDVILKKLNKKIPKILVVGIAYKKNIDDVRESPALKIIKDLKVKNAIVNFHDPFVNVLPKNRNYYIEMKSVKLNKANLKQYDGVLICTDHDDINYDIIYKYSSVIFDSRNRYNFESHKIIRV